MLRKLFLTFFVGTTEINGVLHKPVLQILSETFGIAFKVKLWVRDFHKFTVILHQVYNSFLEA